MTSTIFPVACNKPHLMALQACKGRMVDPECVRVYSSKVMNRCSAVKDSLGRMTHPGCLQEERRI